LTVTEAPVTGCPCSLSTFPFIRTVFWEKALRVKRLMDKITRESAFMYFPASGKGCNLNKTFIIAVLNFKV
jgi:hypothetical protein